MIEKDTIRLLRECDSGVKMGIQSIELVLDCVESENLKTKLQDCKEEHEKLSNELQSLLERYGDEGKSPGIMLEWMAWMKTKMKLLMAPTDATIADLITQGCDMGVKSLNKYLNEYEAADEVSKDITKRLIKIEEKLTSQIRDFL